MFRVLHLPVASLLPVRPESETHLSVLWSGNTWNYRSALDEAGVKGAYVDEEEGNDEFIWDPFFVKKFADIMANLRD